MNFLLREYKFCRKNFEISLDFFGEMLYNTFSTQGKRVLKQIQVLKRFIEGDRFDRTIKKHINAKFRIEFRVFR